MREHEGIWENMREYERPKELRRLRRIHSAYIPHTFRIQTELASRTRPLGPSRGPPGEWKKTKKQYVYIILYI